MQIINILKTILSHPLNKKNKIATIFRFLKWQIGSRLVVGDVAYKWIANTRIMARPGETGVTGNIYCGLHEFPDMSFLLHVLTENDLFVDIGANVGSYTVLSAGVIGAQSYCFEPVPQTYERLVSNIKLNNLESKVTPFNLALGESKGEILFSSDLNCMNHVITDVDTLNTITVSVSTLDQELKDIPFLIKIDVEGYEMAALEGAKNILGNKNLCAVIMELNGSGTRYGYDESDILKLMSSYGFKTYSYEPFKRKLINLKGKNLMSGNTIFIKNVDCILNRINRAPKINVSGTLI